MTEPRELADLVIASFDALDKYEATQESLAEDRGRSPKPGDVYVLEATKDFDVEWAVVAHDPADEARFLVVPADGHVLTGSADVALEDDSPVGALKLRCRFGAWTDARHLRPEQRVGFLGAEGLIRARQQWLDVGDGQVGVDVLGREVDDDPGYQDWVSSALVPARQALIAVQEPEEPQVPAVATGDSVVEDLVTEHQEVGEATSLPASRSHTSMFLRIAASILVAIASLQLWRLNERVQDLEAASRGTEERHGAAIQQLETERDRLMTERERLRSRQQELEVAGAEKEHEARQLRERVSALDQQLVEAEKASEVVNPELVVFSPPEETQRGKKEVTLHPGQSYVVVFIPVQGPSPAPRYQLKVKVKGSGVVIWANDRLVTQKPGEVRAGLPTKILRQGEYEFELLALDDGAFHRVAEYELVVIESLNAPGE